MRFKKSVVFRVVLLVGFLCSCAHSVADELRIDRECSGIESEPHCISLGELKKSLLLAGTFESCNKSKSDVTSESKEAPDSSVIYQFDVSRTRSVALNMQGLGDAAVFKQGTLVFRADEYVASVNLQIDGGQYTLIGRAPLCGNGSGDWSGTYKIRINPDVSDAANIGETADPIQQIAPVPVPKPREKFSIGRWILVGLSSFGALILIFIVAGVTA